MSFGAPGSATAASSPNRMGSVSPLAASSIQTPAPTGGGMSGALPWTGETQQNWLPTQDQARALAATNPGGPGPSTPALPGPGNPMPYADQMQALQQAATQQRQAQLAQPQQPLSPQASAPVSQVGANYNPTGIGMNPAMSYQAPTNPGMLAASPTSPNDAWGPSGQSVAQTPPGYWQGTPGSAGSVFPSAAQQAPATPPPPTYLQSIMSAPQGPMGLTQAQMAAMRGYGQTPSMRQAPQGVPQQRMGVLSSAGGGY